MRNSVIVGDRGHSKVIISMLQKIKSYNIIGYVASTHNMCFA